MSCPACGLANRADAQVCRACGLPVTRFGTPLRGVGQGWFVAPDPGLSVTTAVLGLALVLGLLVVGGALAVTGGGILQYGGRLIADPEASASPDAAVAIVPIQAVPSIAPGTPGPGSEPLASTSTRTSGYTCENGEIRDETRSRWRIGAMRAGARRGFERVTLQLARTGATGKRARISMEWMTPAEARRVFGLPSFPGQRGLLLTFSGQITSSGAQLIGALDLGSQGMDSISGVYRFEDSEGVARTFIAIRDGACARLRAPQLQEPGSAPRSTSILLDLRSR